MKKEIAEAWVKDLRECDVPQAKGELFNGEGYCCLGRLCVVLGESFIEPEGGAHYTVSGTNEYEVLPDKLRVEVEMFSSTGTTRNTESVTIPGIYVDDRLPIDLAEANDNGATFAQIADWIEQNWEIL